MIDRSYFEQVLPDQLKSIGRPCRLHVHCQSGAEYDVASLYCCRESYVILEVHGSGEEPKRSQQWQTEHPGLPPWVFDQVTVPYDTIIATYVTPKGGGATDADSTIGFRLREPG